MNPGALELAGWGFALSALAYAFLAWVQFRRKAEPPAVLAGGMLLVAFLATLLWCSLNMAALLFHQAWALQAVRLSEWLRAGAWMAWIIGLLSPGSQRWPRGAAGALAGLGLVSLGASGLLVLAGPVGMPWPFQWTGLAFLVLSVLVLMLLEQLLRGMPEEAQWGAKPIGVALLALFGFDVYMYSGVALFGGLDGDVYAMRGYVEAVAVPLIWLSLARGDGWIARLRLSQNAAFHSAALLISGAYLIFVASVGYYVRFFGGEWGRALQQGMVFMALVVLVGLALSGSVRARLRVFLSKNFFRYRYDYRDEWLKFTHALSAQGTPQGVGQQVIQGLADLVESPAGGLWIWEAASSSYGQIAHWNMPPIAQAQAGDGALVQVMRSQGLVVNLAEWRDDARRYGGSEPPAWLAGLERAWLVVPLRNGDELIGFVVLLQPRTPFELNWEVYDLLKTAGRQAASFLAQVMATEALLEARKFDAFNRMSAFVVHDLKNIVTQLSLMMKNAKRLHDNPEFRQDMLMTVENSLEKMRQLMAQLREGANASEGNVGVDLAHVSRQLQQLAAAQGRELALRSMPPLRARGGSQRLERVIGHWVQNAIDATTPGQAVWMDLTRLGSFARLVVGDAGKGMSAAFVRDELFRPFRSSKGDGMGIGAYECQQYLQELGGKILVHSEPGQGTQVEMLLPLLELPVASDLDVLKSVR